MGIINFKKLNLQNDNKSNKTIKNSFYLTLAFFGNKKTISNTLSFFLGKKNSFSIINSEHHVEMLKRTIKFCRETGKTNKKILFVNDQINTKFDGIIKVFSKRSGELCHTGKWLGGFFTKSVTKLIYKAIIIYNSQKNVFLIKESNKLGLPMISLCNSHYNILETTYPIICNNSNGNSLLYFSLIISNSIIEGKLCYFIEQFFKIKLLNIF
jgi:ribosomal protein S2